MAKVEHAALPAAEAVSGSALQVALRRAAHQLFDRPVLFHDPFAVRLLGPTHAQALARTPRAQASPAHTSQARARPWSTALRAFAVARSLYAEQMLAAAVARGARQYCLLGAGLDTFAWRNPYPGLRVWELDRPAALAAKQRLATAAGLPTAGTHMPGAPNLTCTQVPGDLCQANLTQVLAAAGLDPAQPTLFAVLGVAPYLPPAAFHRLLATLRAYAPGSGVVLDYRLPRAALPAEEQRQHDSLAARVAAAGEPFQSASTPTAMAAALNGWHRLEDLDSAALNARYFSERTDGLAARGSVARLLSAWR